MVPPSSSSGGGRWLHYSSWRGLERGKRVNIHGCCKEILRKCRCKWIFVAYVEDVLHPDRSYVDVVGGANGRRLRRCFAARKILVPTR